MQDNSWLVKAKPFLLIAAAVLVLFGLMDLSPAFYGPYEFLKDRPGIAPWFSGTATTFGVLVALYNTDRQLKQALDRQATDDLRRQAEEENRRRSLVNAAAQLIGLVAFTAFATREIRSGDNRNFGFESEIHNYTRLLKRMEAFPVLDLQNGNAATSWHRIESNLAVILNAAKAAHEQSLRHETAGAIRECGIIGVHVTTALTMLKLLDENCREFWARIGAGGFEVAPRPHEERIGLRAEAEPQR